MSPQANAFMGALMATGYMLPFLKITEMVCGVWLVMNRFVPLSLTILAPILLNIFLFHVFLDPKGLPVAIFLGAAEIYLAIAYRKNFKQVLVVKT